MPKKFEKLSLAIALRDILKGLDMTYLGVVTAEPDIIETPLDSASNQLVWMIRSTAEKMEGEAVRSRAFKVG